MEPIKNPRSRFRQQFDIQQRLPVKQVLQRPAQQKIVRKVKKIHWPKKWGDKRIAIAAVAFLVFGFFAYNYGNTRSQLNKLADPKTAAEQEAADLAKEIGKFLELPEGETPSIATVKNATQLRDQNFFSKTQNGDKVLIYPESGKAVLYRPSTKKVIEYSLVKLQDPTDVAE